MFIPSSRIKNVLEKGINSLFCDKSDLWIGTNHGIIKFDGKNWLHYYGNYYSFTNGKPVQHKGNSPFEDNYINNIIKNNNKIFFLTDYGIIEYNFDTFKFVHHTGPLQYSLYLNEVIVLNPNTLLLGTWGKGLTLFQIDSSTFKPAEPNISGDVTYVTGITSNLNTLWVSTLTNGIHSSSRSEDKFFSYTTKNSKLNSNRSKGITSFGNDIFLLTSEGLLRLNTKDFVWYYFKKQNSSLTDENITCFNIHNELMYIGTIKGLYSYNKAGHLMKVSNKEIDNTWISNLSSNKDSLWITTKKGELYRMDLSDSDK